jgi:hypothetical protein
VSIDGFAVYYGKMAGTILVRSCRKLVSINTDLSFFSLTLNTALFPILYFTSNIKGRIIKTGTVMLHSSDDLNGLIITSEYNV